MPGLDSGGEIARVKPSDMAEPWEVLDEPEIMEDCVSGCSRALIMDKAMLETRRLGEMSGSGRARREGEGIELVGSYVS